MANEIYLKTHDGLSALISSKAASRMLDSALRSKGHSSETVSHSQMREVLLGPVFKELRTILPSDGVERSLKILISELKRTSQVAVALAEKPQAAAAVAHEFNTAELRTPISDAPAEVATLLPQTQADATVEAAVSPLASLTNTPAQGATVTESAVGAAATPGVTISVRQSVATTAEAAAEDSGAAVQSVASEFQLSEADLETVLVTFAKLEYVRMVAAIRASGEVALSRGGGVDVAALSRLGLTGMRLLERSGQLRSYYLAYSEGQLFIFPLGAFTLIIIGTVDVNLGSVFATLTKLKEGV